MHFKSFRAGKIAYRVHISSNIFAVKPVSIAMISFMTVFPIPVNLKESYLSVSVTSDNAQI